MTTYNTGNPLGSSDPKDLYDNAQAFDQAVNTDQDKFTDRMGNQRRTFTSLQNELDTLIAGAQDAEAGAEAAQGRAATSSRRASAHENTARAQADRAEDAADAAAVSGKTFGTVSAGIGGTTSGEYFTVPGSDSMLSLYLNDSGSPKKIATYPSRETVNNMERGIRQQIRNMPDPILTSLILF